MISNVGWESEMQYSANSAIMESRNMELVGL